MVKQGRVTGRADAVPDPFRTEFAQRRPHLGRAHGLPGVRRAVQPGVPRRAEGRGEVGPADTLLRPAQPDADRARGPVAHREVGRLRRAGRAERGIGVEDPAQLDAVPVAGQGPPVGQRLGQLGEADPGHPVAHRGHLHFGVPHLIRGQLGSQPVDQGEHVGAGPDQQVDLGVDVEEVREGGERVELAQRGRLGGHTAVRVPPGQGQHRLRCGRADQVQVQLGLGQGGDELGDVHCARMACTGTGTERNFCV